MIPPFLDIQYPYSSTSRFSRSGGELLGVGAAAWDAWSGQPDVRAAIRGGGSAAFAAIGGVNFGGVQNFV
jgi:hypothetical protein